MPPVLLHGHGKVPVTIQRAVERDPAGRAVDLAQKWIGSECGADADCNFAGGLCHANAYGRGFCTAACNGSCADRPTEIATACVPGSSGFVGDPCLSSADCAAGRTCERHGQGRGLCTQTCGAAVATTCAKAVAVLACLP